jgi:D-alanyl-D-alanine carboxypeptidase
MKRLLPLALLILLSTGVRAQSPLDVKILDAYFDSLAHYDQAMGTVSIFLGDEERYTRSVGYSDKALSVAATPDHVYRVGSITKTFTAVIVHGLAMDGKLSLDDKLAQYYPELPNADQITLDQMLRHQSGLHNYTATEDVEQWIDQLQTPQQHLARIKKGGSDFLPGEGVSYSNSNFLLLGYIAERVSGQSYAQLLRDYVLTPCNLENTYVGTNDISADRGEVVSFSWDGQAWQPATLWDMSNAGAAGNISSTVNDLGRFYRKVVRGQLLPEAQTKQMLSMRDGLGQGLLTAPFGTAAGYGHNGGIEGFSTMALHFPEQDITIVYLSNGVRLPLNDVLLAGLSVAFGQPLEIPDLRPTPSMEEAVAQQYVGHYTNEIFPLDIDISFANGRLVCQATGQGAFPLSPTEAHTFVFPAASLTLIFTPAEGKMQLLQMGNDFTFLRQ